MPEHFAVYPPRKPLTGRRAVLTIDGTPIGTFDKISFGDASVSPGVLVPAAAAPKIEYAGYEPFTVTCSGWVIRSVPWYLRLLRVAFPDWGES